MSRLTQLFATLLGLDAGSERSAKAREIAQELGARDLYVWTRDVELDVYLPAPGFPKTFPSGGEWQRFVAGCAAEGARSERLPKLGSPAGVMTMAHGVVVPSRDGGVIFVLVEGTPDVHAISEAATSLALAARAFELEAAGNRARLAAVRHATEIETARGLSASLEASRLELEESRAQLANAYRAKDELLAIVSHELRNPLAPILMAVELMRVHRSDLFERERSVIERQARYMSRLVDDLMDVARIARGSLDLRRARIELSAVVTRALETIGPALGSERNVTIDVPTIGLLVDGDAGRLVQVVTNLLANASKYSPKGTPITVRARRDPENVTLAIADEGFGIAPDLVPVVFDHFVQGARTLDRSRGGLGLGLAIVKGIVEAHGGVVRVESGGIGKGSVFTVSLPRATAEARKLDTLEV